jgi:RNA polymerase sigma-70 factor (ECF subfamily)
VVARQRGRHERRIVAGHLAVFLGRWVGSTSPVSSRARRATETVVDEFNPGGRAPKHPSTRVLPMRTPVTARSAPTVADPRVVDEAALREAFNVHGGQMLGFARRALESAAAAEDAVQETFVRAWRYRSRFDSSLGSLRTWLFSILRRVILDAYARRDRVQVVSLSERDDVIGDDHLEVAMRGWQVDSALARLPVEHRAVLTELYFRGRSGREAAEILNIPEGTVRSRTFYALRLLREHLEEAGWSS